MFGDLIEIILRLLKKSLDLDSNSVIFSVLRIWFLGLFP